MRERFVMYADVEVHEWGEKDRVERIGPFSAEDGLECDPDGASDQLHRNLAERGEDVLRIDVEYL